MRLQWTIDEQHCRVRLLFKSEKRILINGRNRDSNTIRQQPFDPLEHVPRESAGAHQQAAHGGISQTAESNQCRQHHAVALPRVMFFKVVVDLRRQRRGRFSHAAPLFVDLRAGPPSRRCFSPGPSSCFNSCVTRARESPSLRAASARLRATPVSSMAWICSARIDEAEAAEPPSSPVEDKVNSALPSLRQSSQSPNSK